MKPSAVSTPLNFIDGGFRPAADGEMVDVVNPSTGKVIARAPASTSDDVDAAVSAAERAFSGPWGDTTPAERATLLLRLADIIVDHSLEFADLESINVGKPRGDAAFEITEASDVLRYMAGVARVPEGSGATEYKHGATSFIRREPIGVAGQITPWNFPLLLAVFGLAPALAAGNCVVLKPSEVTPLSTLRLAQLAADVFPAGVINVVAGDGETTGNAIASHPRVRIISLIGSTVAGRKVAGAALGNLKRVHLELGGKAPVVVYDDADLAAVARTLKGASFANSGQDCTAACRVLVQDTAYDDLMSALLSEVDSMVVGDPFEGEIDMGPVISESHRGRVLGFVDRAADAGASVLTGGNATGSRGFFVEPTVIAKPDQASELIQQEVFGPVVSVQTFGDEEQALKWANDVEYGLAASVWTQNIQRGMRAVRNLEYGCVWVNDHLNIFSEMPHGGFKQSGYGKDLGKYGYEDYTVPKHVLIRFDE